MSPDELSVSPMLGRAGDFSALTRVAFLSGVESDTRGNATVTLSTPAVDVAQLTLYRSALGARGYRSRAVLYASSAKVREESTRRFLSNEFSIGLRSAEDLDAILDMHDLSVVRSIEFMPDIWAVRCESGGLLASLEIANALYKTGLAVFATPLIARWR